MFYLPNILIRRTMYKIGPDFILQFTINGLSAQTLSPFFHCMSTLLLYVKLPKKVQYYES